MLNPVTPNIKSWHAEYSTLARRMLISVTPDIHLYVNRVQE